MNTTLPNPRPKTLHIKTWGCQMNVYDSQRMADVLAPLGFVTTDNADGADMIVLNTCHIREKATEKLFSELGRMRAHKRAGEKRGQNVILAVAGCVAQAEGDVIFDRAPYVDMVFGPQAYHNLAEMVADATGAKKNRIINTDFPPESKFDHLPAENTNISASAFLAVQEGCDKFCTFCVVPYTRGAEFSRPPTTIIEEAKRLADGGAVELNLLGQNVNAYHGDGWSLARLLEELVVQVPQIKRLRYTTSHPRDMQDDLIAAHRDVPQLMPYLNLPIQSGSNDILKAMNRKHDRDFYLDIMDRVRAARPDIALCSDFIVGFPGETDRDFEDTLDVVKQVGFAAAYAFKYSARPGTPAAAMPGLLPEKVKEERLDILLNTLTEQHLAYNQACVGKTEPVLFDRKGHKENQLIGRTPHNQSIFVENVPSDWLGGIHNIRIIHAAPQALRGEAAA